MTECCLAFSNPISKQTTYSLVVDVIEYVLFYRGQIPFLSHQNKSKDHNQSISSSGSSITISNKTQTSRTEFGNIVIYCDADNKSNQVVHKPRRAEQLFMEALSQFHVFFEELSSFLQCNHVLEIVLKIGSTFPNPEIYHIKLPTVCENADCNEDCTSMHKCRSQVYQALFKSNFASDLIEKPMSISVMLHLSPGAKLMSNMEYKRCYKIPKSSKCKRVYFDCSCSHISNNSVPEELPVDDPQCTTSSDVTSNTPFWVLIKPTLKGVPKKKV